MATETVTTHQMIHADFLKWAPTQPENSVDLVFGSPPYEDARTYSVGFRLKGQDWVDWMVEVVQQSLRLSQGLVAFVLEGRTRQFRWSATPALLMADLHRVGVHLRKPPAYHRVGIPGSGGPDWLRNDFEFIVCATSGGKLPWSDNTAMGHPPKWAPGGAMSHRLTDGTRRNQWGHSGTGKSGARKQDGGRQDAVRPSHRLGRGNEKGSPASQPAIANPGNVIHCKVGGGLMGYDKADSDFASENEAPFPVSLAEFFVRSYCPPGGTTLDPFGGSGTTAVVCHEFDRQSVSLDIRPSQIELMEKRLDVRLRQERLF